MLICLSICAALYSHGRKILTPAETEARAPRLPFEQTDLANELPKGQELGMVSWIAGAPTSGAAADSKKVREWGTSGTDREGGRIERFDPDGRFLGESTRQTARDRKGGLHSVEAAGDGLPMTNLAKIGFK